MHTITTTVRVPEDRHVVLEIDLPPECGPGEMEVTLSFRPIDGEGEEKEVRYPAAMVELFEKYRDIIGLGEGFVIEDGDDGATP